MIPLVQDQLLRLRRAIDGAAPGTVVPSPPPTSPHHSTYPPGATCPDTSASGPSPPPIAPYDP
ncbi:hypothetical protein [Streptomyces sp. NRRL S-646]|uniref:hypothetical protein n=1 Tax=Streptomyces sp. NRRL S-646 TaxID=1463917 RepID=UPI0004CC084F|nr:hypothetical protein [Streptomyces sp. NRRL S-646]